MRPVSTGNVAAHSQFSILFFHLYPAAESQPINDESSCPFSPSYSPLPTHRPWAYYSHSMPTMFLIVHDFLTYSSFSVDKSIDKMKIVRYSVYALAWAALSRAQDVSSLKLFFFLFFWSQLVGSYLFIASLNVADNFSLACNSPTRSSIITRRIRRTTTIRFKIFHFFTKLIA